MARASLIWSLLPLLAILCPSSAFVPPAQHHGRNFQSHQHVLANKIDCGAIRRCRPSSKLRMADSAWSGHKQPWLARALETAIRWTIKNILLRQCSTIAVGVGAASNRALLRGELDEISISTRNCISRFNFFSLGRFDLTGVKLRLGYVPFVLPVLPFLLWRLFRGGYLWTMVFGMVLLRRTGKLQDPLLPELQRIVGQLYYRLGARPSKLNYSLAVTNEDISQSFMWRFWLQSILKSLVLNSPFVGAAAALGDVQNSAIEDINSQRIAEVEGTNLQVNSQQKGVLTSALLTATSFQLKDASFSNGKVILNADAIMPLEQGQSSGDQKTFSFTVRARIKPLDNTQRTDKSSMKQQSQHQCNNSLGFVDPECRLFTTPLTGRGSFFAKLVPDFIWIPFGPGVIVPIGGNNEVYRAEAVDGNETNGICRVDGSISLFKLMTKQVGLTTSLATIAKQ